MLNKTVIQAENLSKLYRIGPHHRYKTLRDTITDAFTAGVRRLKKTQDRSSDYIWALKDVSFEIKQGEVVGIIGPNGAGKTTLLKILSRITPPTEGSVELTGRVASLLEVGTGFHPELTGRDNIYLNGAILGMRKREIDRKFEAIVSFAEVEKFMDTPIKHYSSGMYVRLAFAVAAHLEPEILLVDEVLAVGDFKFQQKCLGKMSEVAKAGRTVLFVSHNLSAIARLCPNSLLLNSGRLEFNGPTKECVRLYLGGEEDSKLAEVDLSSVRRPDGLGTALRFLKIRLLSAPNCNLKVGQPLELEIEFQVTRTLRGVGIGMGIHSLEGIRIFDCRSTDSYPPLELLRPGNYSLSVGAENNLLRPGDYLISLGGGIDSGNEGLDRIENAIQFHIVPVDMQGLAYFDVKEGFFRINSQWTKPLIIS